ncbi:VOC family protein [Streptomyces oceani]|uniref:Bleomycin resistance protein n=1 Tax=Streptomyces oceani TaxID=1075402 RepID=A0A1E7KJW8_9ACTN|nr:VOC family protein [Streptomyces oceani]OEV04210.1 bleomycin resistance protein [Streptomyces oceani]
MAVELNHTIVSSSDKQASAAFLAELLGLRVGERYGPFLPLLVSNGVTLDYADQKDGAITPQHYAFLVSETDFDAIFGRIKQAGLTYYADPGHGRPGEINNRDGGRGTYFDDPDGHSMEILTRPYGSGG